MKGKSFFSVALVSAALLTAFPVFACPECASGKTAVLVVDLQGDFTAWKDGPAAAPGTDKSFVEKVQKATETFSRRGYLIFGVQDWHPADHSSFYTAHEGKRPFEAIEIGGRSQILLPPHCIQGTENARLLVDNNLFRAIVQKGRDPLRDCRSAFRDDGGKRTEMEKVLRRNLVTKVIVYGIGIDGDVAATADDAADAGYRVVVIEDLCRGTADKVVKKALGKMREKGVVVIKGVDPKRIEDL